MVLDFLLAAIAKVKIVIVIAIIAAVGVISGTACDGLAVSAAVGCGEGGTKPLGGGRVPNVKGKFIV